MQFKHLWIVGLVMMVTAVMMGCSPVGTTPTAEPPTQAAVDGDSVVAEGGAVEAVLEAAGTGVISEATSPAWQTLPLTNARTGETFRLADFAGKTVYVEPMATWCINCRAQQNIVREVRTQLGDGDYVYLSLSVEVGVVSASDLAQYAERENYGWMFAVATPEMLAALTEQFGLSISNPPSTPHFIIYPDGTFSDLQAGRRHSVDELVTALTATGA